VGKACRQSCDHCQPVSNSTHATKPSIAHTKKLSKQKPLKAAEVSRSAGGSARGGIRPSSRGSTLVFRQGTCASHDCQEIGDYEACKAAAKQHGWKGSPHTLRYRGLPQGCSHRSDGVTYLNKALSWQTASDVHLLLCNCQSTTAARTRKAIQQHSAERQWKKDYAHGCVNEDRDFCENWVDTSRTCDGPYYYKGRKISVMCAKTCDTCTPAQLQGSAARLQRSSD